MPSQRRMSRAGPSSACFTAKRARHARATLLLSSAARPASSDCKLFDSLFGSYLFELEQEIVTLRRELAARGGGDGPPSVLPGLGGGPAPPQSASPNSIQAQYFAGQEAGSSNQFQQGYAHDDLPQGAIVQSPPYGNFYPHPPPPPEIKSEGQSQPQQQQHQQQQQHSAYQPMMIDPSLQQNGYQPQGYSHARQSSSNGSMTPGASGLTEASGSQSSGVPGRDIGSLLNGVGFAGHESGEQKFMGSSSGSAFPFKVLRCRRASSKLTPLPDVGSLTRPDGSLERDEDGPGRSDASELPAASVDLVYPFVADKPRRGRGARCTRPARPAPAS